MAKAARKYNDGIAGGTPLGTWDGASGPRTMASTERVLLISGCTDDRTLKLPKTGVKKGDGYLIIISAITNAKTLTITDQAGSPNTIEVFGNAAGTSVSGFLELVALEDEPEGATNNSWYISRVMEMMTFTFDITTGAGSGASNLTGKTAYVVREKTRLTVSMNWFTITTGTSPSAAITTNAGILPTRFTPATSNYAVIEVKDNNVLSPGYSGFTSAGAITFYNQTETAWTGGLSTTRLCASRITFTLTLA